jgi:hypothetical protein
MMAERSAGVRARTSRFWKRRSTRIVAATVSVLLGVGAIPVMPPVVAQASDSWAYPGRLDDGLTAARQDRCRLGFVTQAGGPAVRAVAQTALNGTDAQMHTAADPSYWNDTPLSAAYEQDQTTRSSTWTTLGNRHYTWDQSIPGTMDLPTDTVTGFHWSPDFYSQLGITSFYVNQFFQGEDKLYVDLAPIASPASLTSAVNLAKQLHYYYLTDETSANINQVQAWEYVGDWDFDGSVVTGKHHADDISEFLQFGGWPSVAPAPDSAEFRLEVEALKQRFSSCDTENPLDPYHVLAPAVHQAAAEWQAELDSQKTQRSAIVAAQVAAFNDLQTAAVAMGEAVGQSWIAGQLDKWKAYWSPGGPGTAGSGPITIKLKNATTSCVDDAGSGTADGTKIQAYTCNSTGAQQWKPGGWPGIYSYLDGSLVNATANKCMDLSGTNVVLATCSSSKTTQHWQYTTTGGQTRLFNVGANKCLNYAATTNGTQGTVQTCNSSATAQQFILSQNNSGTNTGTDSMSYPKAADFTYATNEIVNAQNRATAQQTIANNASADAQTQATAVTNAQNTATNIANSHNYPVGRGLAYAQQSAQVVKASAAAAQAAAQATTTAVQATKAAVADSAALVQLAQTQAAAMRAQYAKSAAQEAARQAQAAAASAAAEATAAAADAATAKAKRTAAEQAKATAQTAAAEAARQRGIAEQQRQIAAQQRAIAESKHAAASAADADAATQAGIAVSARATAEADAQTAADRDFDAESAASNASIARQAAVNAAAKHDALAARAEALQAAADAAEGTAAAAAARQAANDAQAAADQAASAAAQAQQDADAATQAAEAARAAATAAHAAAARSLAAANHADEQVAITRSAMAAAHSAAADALAAARDAKDHANNADADAAAAEAAMHQASLQSAAALAAARDATAHSALTAGQAYATSMAAIAARDSAAAVAAPANTAVGLGAPFVDRDSSAALAVLVGQGALTVAQQQAAAAQARSDEASAAAATAQALANSATGDAKIAAQSAADAATSSLAAANSAKAARASAAAAAADAAAAAQADADTAALNAQAERDAAAAHAAATAAANDANAADSEADAAERDAASARALAAQAAQDATAAQAAATAADASADAAEAAAQRAQQDAAAAEQAATDAEAQAREIDKMNQVVDTWDGGYVALMLRPDLTVDAWSGHCSTGGGSHTCDIDVPLHMHGVVYYDLILCTLNGTTSATCISQPLGTAPIDITEHRTLHIDVRDVMQAAWKNLVNLFVGDFISCGKAISKGTVNLDCAWAAAQLIPYGKIAKWVEGIVGVNRALRAGVGIDKALELAKASELPAEVLPRLSEDAAAVTKLVDCAANAARSAGLVRQPPAGTITVRQPGLAREGDAEVCPITLLSAAGKASYATLRAAVDRVRALPAADIRAALSDAQITAGRQEPYLRSMFVGSAVENLVAQDAAVAADAKIAHLGTAAPGQAVADFVITDGALKVNIDVTGSSATSISNHLGRAYIVGRDQIIDYSTFSPEFLAEVFQ